VLLEYEHYDAFSPVLEFRTANNLPVYHTLLDNVTVCDAGLISRGGPRDRQETDNDSDISIYSGLWMQQYAGDSSALKRDRCKPSFVDTV
jgi:hypothetical protein